VIVEGIEIATLTESRTARAPPIAPPIPDVQNGRKREEVPELREEERPLQCNRLDDFVREKRNDRDDEERNRDEETARPAPAGEAEAVHDRIPDREFDGLGDWHEPGEATDYR
jgi:hypothetical protein